MPTKDPTDFSPVENLYSGLLLFVAHVAGLRATILGQHQRIGSHPLWWLLLGRTKMKVLKAANESSKFGLWFTGVTGAVGSTISVANSASPKDFAITAGVAATVGLLAKGWAVADKMDD